MLANGGWDLIQRLKGWRRKTVTFQKVVIVLIIGDDRKSPCFCSYHGETAHSRRGPPQYRGFVITLRQTHHIR